MNREQSKSLANTVERYTSIKEGYLTISAENNDYEALTLGAFINLLHRRAKENIKAITIVF